MRNAIEEAAAVGAGIGMIVFAVNYPVGFGITMAIVFLFSAVLVGFMPSRSRRGDWKRSLMRVCVGVGSGGQPAKRTGDSC